MRRIVIACALGAVLWFSYGQDQSTHALTQKAMDLFDARPARSVLIVGNSRTYFHDMPSMVREIADSARSPTKLQIETSAYADATFESLWKDGRTRRLLSWKWDEVILQGESRGQSSSELNQSFLSYGTLLGHAAAVSSRRPRLLVNWAYDPSAYPDDADGNARRQHLASILEAHRRLASAADLQQVHLAELWEFVRREYPEIALTEDGNHPTLAGSYLVALAIYADLSDPHALSEVKFVPTGLAAGNAAKLRSTVLRSNQ